MNWFHEAHVYVVEGTLLLALVIGAVRFLLSEIRR